MENRHKIREFNSIDKNDIDKNDIDKNDVDKNEIDKNDIDKNDVDKNDIDKNDVDKNDIDKNDVDKNDIDKNKIDKNDIGTDLSYKHEIVTINVFGLVGFHGAGISGLLLVLSGACTLGTVLWTIAMIYIVNMGVTVGAHRYYTHRSFKATRVLQFILIIAQTISGQNSVFTWARDHRTHHRLSDTDADPHNAKRGFFFSHIGWIMSRKHHYVKEFGNNIDVSDLLADPLVRWQKKYFMPIYVVVALVIPVGVPVFVFGETWIHAVLVCFFFRFLYTNHATWLVNSAAHLYGNKSYDKKIQPVESWFVSLVTSGEGWHNYHHTFPWDYKAAEDTMPLNLSASLIRFFEKIGWAYDLKSADPLMIQKRILRTGDGTHYTVGTDQQRAAVTATKQTAQTIGGYLSGKISSE